MGGEGWEGRRRNTLLLYWRDVVVGEFVSILNKEGMASHMKRVVRNATWW